MKRHIWIVHEKRKIYECDMCENQFHENSHENDFTKDEMMKSWRNKTVHEGIKDHKCTECGKFGKVFMKVISFSWNHERYFLWLLQQSI